MAGIQTRETGKFPKAVSAVSEHSHKPRRRFSDKDRFSPSFWLGLFLVGLVLLGALAADLPFMPDPNAIHAAGRLSSPGLDFPFGADQLGRDVFGRLLQGARFALTLSVLSTSLSVLVGVSFGLLSGYWAGWLDIFLSRLMDALLAFPALLLAIVLAARLGPSLQTTILALGIMGVPSFFRITRSGIFAIKNSEYVLSARSIGARHGRIVLCHIIPNLGSTLLVLISLRLGTMVLAGSGLSFIGLGVQPPDADWGVMLASSRSLLGEAWWLAVFPGLAITLTVLGFNLLGDGLRDLLFLEQK